MITLKRATREAISYACLKFHYAKAVPAAYNAYNVYNDRSEWCGVIIFGGGATPNIIKPFGMKTGEVMELVRVALNGKQPCTSECVSAALRQLHKDEPQVKLIVSYADMDQGHYGTIYQATNWIYLGTVNEGLLAAFIIHGKRMHRKSVHSHGWVQSIGWLREHVDPDAGRPGIFHKRQTEIYLCIRQTASEGMAEKGRPLSEKIMRQWFNGRISRDPAGRWRFDSGPDAPPLRG